jgi:hypothetical protein
MVLTIGIVPANASKVWKWQYSGPGITASGTFITVDTPDATGAFLITAIRGTRNGVAITTLQPPGTSIPGNEPYLVDDLVFAGHGAQLTKGGFGFATAQAFYSNPFYAGFLPHPGYLEFFSMPGTGHEELAIQFSATPVPEPVSVALVFGGLAFLIPLLARRSDPNVSPRSVLRHMEGQVTAS